VNRVTKQTKAMKSDVEAILLCLKKNQNTGINLNNISRIVCSFGNVHRTPEFVAEILDQLIKVAQAKVKRGPDLWRLTDLGIQRARGLR
jgi:SLT domain-containing protein